MTHRVALCFCGTVWAILFFLCPRLSIADIDGTYTIVAGRTPTGRDYAGSLAITKRNEAFDLAWQLSDGSKQVGIGIVHDNHLIAAFQSRSATYGLISYENRSGRLLGKWLTPEVVAKGSQFGEEILNGPMVLGGIYQITSGKDSDGRPYSGVVTINGNGSIYLLNWALPSETYNGVGIAMGSNLVAAWGQGQGFGVVDYRIEGEKLSGLWAATGFLSSGTETLTRK